MNSDQLPVNSEDSPRSSDSGPQGDNKEAQGKSEAVETPSPLRGRPPSQGESFVASPQDEQERPPKTQGIRVSRGNGADVLRPAAERAAQSGRRNDVHEYMRLRRSYV